MKGLIFAGIDMLQDQSLIISKLKLPTKYHLGNELAIVHVSGTSLPCPSLDKE